MFTSDMSLTMTAMRSPSRLRSAWLSSVVFPDPRKPESTVTGRRSVAVMAEGTLSRDDVAEAHPATIDLLHKWFTLSLPIRCSLWLG